ncbi:MAG: hypothetical protein HYV07_11105 [Deltaproteobacteria bacterium]|nr:hypothetical protein [Deltaproteobacteria bacterium]
MRARRARPISPFSILLATACADPLRLVAVTFNSGTSEGLPHDAAPDDGYGAPEAEISDRWYGDGLAWSEVLADTQSFFRSLEADVVAFQEIFHPGECAGIPAEARAGWVCESWAEGDPSVAQLTVGSGYQVACNVGKADKCLAVRREFGELVGCASDLCLDGLAGARIPDCGSGSRIGRGVISLESGGELTVVLVHGSSGLAEADAECRRLQMAQVFVDLGTGDGPAANGERNLVLGDFNTDPVRLAGGDVSAEALSRLAAGRGFHFVSSIGEDAVPTYAGLVSIDHQLSDTLTGTCWSAGIGGRAPVTEIVYFDHRPLVCELGE